MKEILQDRGHVAIAMDFAENYTILEPYEVQTQYFSNRQVVMLVMIVYRRVSYETACSMGLHKSPAEHDSSDDSDSDDDAEDADSDVIITEQYFFISEDNNKGSEFVHHCIVKLLNHWRDIGRDSPDFIHTWSDGCAGDFKSRHVFLDRAMLWLQIAADAPPGSLRTMVLCNFFESGHGKGPWDAAGGWLKHELQKEGICSEHGQGLRRTLHDIAEFVNKKHSKPTQSVYKSRNQARRLTSRHCFIVEQGEVDYTMKSKARLQVKDTLQMHQLICVGGTTRDVNDLCVAYRLLSCYCTMCTSDRQELCLHKHHVGELAQVQLCPADSTTAGVLEDVRQAAADAGVFAAPLAYGDLVTASIHYSSSSIIEPAKDPPSCWIAVRPSKGDTCYNFWIMWVVAVHEKQLHSGQCLVRFSGYFLELHRPPELEAETVLCQTPGSVYTLEKRKERVDVDTVVYSCFTPRLLSQPVPGNGQQLFTLDKDDYHQAMLGVSVRHAVYNRQ